MNILFIAAEADPFAKVGGLGDVAGSLPLALKSIEPDMDIRLAIPFYKCVNLQDKVPRLAATFTIPSICGLETAKVYEINYSGLPVYLVSGRSIELSESVYSCDCEKDAENFIFFSLACLYLPQYIHWKVDILHANDWHTAIAIHELKNSERKIPFGTPIKSLLTLHNLPFMGSGSEKALKKYDILPSTGFQMPDWARTLPLPMGIAAADRIVAVSPTYAEEILDPAFSCDLHNFLRSNKSKITGIVNGIDSTIWNPSSDKQIPQNYSSANIQDRQINKKKIQKELGLTIDSVTPLITFIGRLDLQKGIDLAVNALRKIQNRNWQMIFLGTGNAELESLLQEFQKEYSQNVRAILRFDSSLAHRLYAGADILFMPSRYEPCGLAQLIAMRYGCIPVANSTGGLKDTIIDFEKNILKGTGFLYSPNNEASLIKKIEFALDIFSSAKSWRNLQANAMKRDFSWQTSAKSYLSIYRDLLQ